ncbi:hypothetical protein XBFM1_1600003 [Xenorhabdus bovienii str. feltiae Moldova]|uniref:Uncharacterized protein n=1 Tax=Xenorhabdus bovienii str. feltiae Moldova TaxID=1398200 RepID=A0A077NNG5_XENBV|nr:hypothetical protein XBFM1_1600003 [Xenorhabdus bovienii str. feltiae Moldova]
MVKSSTHFLVKNYIDKTENEFKALISGMYNLINNKEKIIQWQKQK